MTRTTQPYEIREWLGGIPETADVTDEQVAAIGRAWDRLAVLHAELDPDDPDRAEAGTAAAMYILGDTTVADAGAEVARYRMGLISAMEALTGVMVAADQAGVSEAEIARESGLTRVTVRKRLGR